MDAVIAEGVGTGAASTYGLDLACPSGARILSIALAFTARGGYFPTAWNWATPAFS